MIYSLLGLAVLVALFAWFIKKRESVLRPQRAKLSYQLLLRKTRGDNTMAERLIEYESKRHPQWVREQLIVSALESWERSNR